MKAVLLILSLILTGCPIDTDRGSGPDNRARDKREARTPEFDCRSCGDLNRPCCPSNTCQMVYDQPLNGKKCLEGLQCLPDPETNRPICGY